MRKILIISASVLGVLGIAAICFFNIFKLKKIEIDGCQIVSEEEVREAIEANGSIDNTVIMYLKNKFKPVDGIAFVAKIDVEMAGKDKVVVTVYEKQSAGCIEYMDNYIYFDKDGIVLESTSRKVDKVPCIDGLKFTGWSLGEKLPIDDENRFKNILTITQLIDKYELEIDGIRFTDEGEIVLTCGKIKIEMGDGSYLPIQLMNLGSILDGLKGQSGTLYMKDFNSDSATASFKKN